MTFGIAKTLLVLLLLVGAVACGFGILIMVLDPLLTHGAMGNMVEGAILIAGGLFTCATTQFALATIVTAENTTEIKNLLTKLVDQNTKQSVQPIFTGYPSKPIGR